MADCVSDDVPTSVGACRLLERLRSQVSEVEVCAFGEADVRMLLGGVRGMQRCLDGLIMRLGVRANQLAEAGASAPAVDVLRSDGLVGSRQARRESARADLAGSIDGLAEAVLAGEASGEHVDVLARSTACLSDDQREHLDLSALIEKARDLPVETFERTVRRAIRAVTADHDLADTDSKRAASEFRHWFDRDTGMGRFSGSLDPERYEAFTNAIEHHVATLAATSDGSTTKSPNLAVAALVDLVLAAGGRDARNRLPAITVMVDGRTLLEGPHLRSVQETERGHDLSPESIARLRCDAVVRRVVLDDGGLPIDVGRKHRTATDAQWAALKALHRTCAWERCDRPINWCQAHHIVEWERGGQTDLDNLVPLCSEHHHRVHEGRWRITLRPDRRLDIQRPDGAHHATVPRPQRC